MTHKPVVSRQLFRVSRNGPTQAVDRVIANEVPVALEFNGIGYAVLMATPANLEDLVAGFLLAERLHSWDDIAVDPVFHAMDDGIVARASLSAAHTAALLDRVRHRATDSSCGLCGIENIEQAMRALPVVTAKCRAADAAIIRAIEELATFQTLNGQTGAMHGAALVDRDGAIRIVREDVGRHNAFDKLIGAMRRGGLGWDGGFALLSSRCSYELVEKAALANCPMLVTLSAPTRLALDRAAGAGLDLRTLARSDAYLATRP